MPARDTASAGATLRPRFCILDTKHDSQTWKRTTYTETPAVCNLCRIILHYSAFENNDRLTNATISSQVLYFQCVNACMFTVANGKEYAIIKSIYFIQISIVTSLTNINWAPLKIAFYPRNFYRLTSVVFWQNQRVVIAKFHFSFRPLAK